ncbi:hypothetical protein [Limosilactobacillus reuteri]|uniref:hypothetical protein n=1 Tax=Limosilactobacillus reuteri TaxID=1598 RepID=UPI002B057700|nr:hypothetical protein [Limosilactobacillus reuteri]
MANLSKIYTGMLNGPEIINANFNNLNQAVHMTDWSTEGIVMLNGWHGTVKYRFVQLNDIKLVCLTYNIFGDFNGETRIFQLPVSAAPSSWIELKGNTAWEILKEDGLWGYGQGSNVNAKNQQLTNTHLYLLNV